MVPEQSWYVISGGLEQGPFDPAAIRSLVQRGQIKPNTLIRRGDQPAPVAASTIRGLLPMPSTEPYIPPEAPAPATAPGKALTTAMRRPPAAASSPAPVRQTGSVRKPAAATTGRTTRAAPAPAPVPEEAYDDGDAEVDSGDVPEGRADVPTRFRSMFIDLVLVGGLVGGLIAGAYFAAAGAEGKAVALIESQRAEKSAANAKTEGSVARPLYATWPATRLEWEATLDAKKKELEAADAAIAAFTPAPVKDAATFKIKSPDQLREEDAARKQAGKLREEVKFQVEILDYEIKSYEKESAVVRLTTQQAQRNGTILSIMAAVLGIALLPLTEAVAGGTPGKLLTGLRTVGSGRRSVSFGAAFVRHFARLVPIGYLQLSGDPQRLAWHDRASHTEVVIASAVTRKKRGATTRVTRR